MNITLTEAQIRALSFSHVDFEFYINSIVEGQVKLAEDEIVKQTFQYCIDNNIQLPTTRSEIITFGFNNGIVKTAIERDSEIEASRVSLEQPQEPV